MRVAVSVGWGMGQGLKIVLGHYSDVTRIGGGTFISETKITTTVLYLYKERLLYNSV